MSEYTMQNYLNVSLAMREAQMSIIIQQVDNGWIITNITSGGKTEVYLEEERMLTRVHQLVSDWDVGDIVSITK